MRFTSHYKTQWMSLLLDTAHNTASTQGPQVASPLLTGSCKPLRLALSPYASYLRLYFWCEEHSCSWTTAWQRG